MPKPKATPGLSELTVTCNQCGSADLERLDRKEYRCRHCGATTLVSDDDADRLEALLHRVLDQRTTQPAGGLDLPPATRARAVLVAATVLGVLMLVVVMTGVLSHRSSIGPSVPATEVPIDQVPISTLVWDPKDGSYDGVLYNHSGYAIDVPRFTLTVYNDGVKGDSSYSSVTLNRLLPGEFAPIHFNHVDMARTAGRGDHTPPARYEIERPDSIDRATGEIARLSLSEAQLVHEEGGDKFHLVGLVENSYRRPIDGARVIVSLFGLDHQLLGTGDAYVEALRPGEKGLVDAPITVRRPPPPEGNAEASRPAATPVEPVVTAYDYLIDAQFRDRP